MDEDSEKVLEEIKKKMDELEKKIKEIEELKLLLKEKTEEGKRRVRISAPGVKIVASDDEGTIEVGNEVTGNLVRIIRESIRRSLAQIGEDTLSDIIEEMPEEMASSAMKSVSIPERIKIMKLLYSGSKTYGEIARHFPESYPKSTLQYHLQKLRSVKLIEFDEISGKYELTSRGRSLLRLMGIFYGALRGGELEES